MGQRGFALLIVLWTLVLLSLILAQLLSAGRSEAQLATKLRDAAVAEAVADGAVQDTLFHLMAQGAQAWPPHGVHLVRMRARYCRGYDRGPVDQGQSEHRRY